MGRSSLSVNILSGDYGPLRRGTLGPRSLWGSVQCFEAGVSNDLCGLLLGESERPATVKLTI
jgi:hypothetical protein